MVFDNKKYIGGANYGSNLGTSVATDGVFCIAGAPSPSYEYYSYPYAEMYKYSKEIWNYGVKISGGWIFYESFTDHEVDSLFGNSIAMDDHTLIIGAPRSKTGSNGKVYIYTYTEQESWSLQQILTNTEIGSAYFGWSVDIYNDTCIISDPYDYSSGNFRGAAYIYTKSDGTWTQQTKLNPNYNTREHANYYSLGFGSAVSIKNGVCVIGAIGITDRDNLDKGYGRAHIFTGSGSNWLEQAVIYGNNIATRVGEFVSANPNLNAISYAHWTGTSLGFDGYIKFYNNSGSLQTQVYNGTTGYLYKMSSSIEKDGERNIIGLVGEGKAYLYSNITTEEQEINKGYSDTTDGFGYDADIYRDQCIIGAPYFDSTFDGSPGLAILFYDLDPPPILTNELPSDGSEDIAVTTDIQFDILNNPDFNTINIYISDSLIYDGSFISGYTNSTINSISDGYRFVLKHDVDFNYLTYIQTKVTCSNSSYLISDMTDAFVFKTVRPPPQAPYFSNQDPFPNEIDISIYKNINFNIIEPLDGVDKSSIFIYIEGDLAYDGSLDCFISPFDGISSSISEISDGYKFVIDNTNIYDYSSEISIRGIAKNDYMIQLTMDETYNFTTINAQPPYLDGYDPYPFSTDISQNTNIEFNIKEPVGKIVHQDSILVYINEILAYDGDLDSFISPFNGTDSLISSITDGYNIIVDNTNSYDDGYVVNVRVIADNNSLPSLTMDGYYYFTIANSGYFLDTTYFFTFEDYPQNPQNPVTSNDLLLIEDINDNNMKKSIKVEDLPIYKNVNVIYLAVNTLIASSETYFTLSYIPTIALSSASEKIIKCYKDGILMDYDDSLTDNNNWKFVPSENRIYFNNSLGSKYTFHYWTIGIPYSNND